MRLYVEMLVATCNYSTLNLSARVDAVHAYSYFLHVKGLCSLPPDC